MGRVLVGVVGALLIGFAVWAAMPSTAPQTAPVGAGPGANGQALNGPTPIVPHAEPPTPRGADELDARIAGCIGAQHSVAAARAARGGPAPAGAPSDAAVVSRGCAPLYAEPSCRTAMMKYDDAPPERRSAAVLETCARAYCGKLAGTKPAVCGHIDAVPQDEQQFQEWSELRTAILTHDIGASAAQIVLAGPPRAR